jgi:hypothetical protein
MVPNHNTQWANAKEKEELNKHQWMLPWVVRVHGTVDKIKLSLVISEVQVVTAPHFIENS